MLIGVPKEIKNHEYRVGMTPTSVREAVHHGHEVLVETGAGDAIGANDKAYEEAGAGIAKSAKEVFDQAEMIVKIKEPQPEEIEMLQEGQVLFTYLHLAPDPEQTKGLMDAKVTAIAYETVTDNQGGLPLLAPMSAVAGRLAVQAAAHYLEKPQDGEGILLGGVPGVLPGNVVIIGDGVVGSNAAHIAQALGADVTLIGHNAHKMQRLDEVYQGKVKTLASNKEAVEYHVTRADAVITAVLVPGASAPKLITREMIKKMKAGSVIVDVSIDQGGCLETSKPTTHSDPVFTVDGVIHYCVANMPGAVPRTSTFAINNATLPFVIKLADQGYRQAMLDDPNLLNGLNVHAGKITNKAVAESLDLDYADPEGLLT